MRATKPLDTGHLFSQQYSPEYMQQKKDAGMWTSTDEFNYRDVQLRNEAHRIKEEVNRLRKQVQFSGADPGSAKIASDLEERARVLQKQYDDLYANPPQDVVDLLNKKTQEQADVNFAAAQEHVRKGEFYHPQVMEQYILRPVMNAATNFILNGAASIGRTMDAAYNAVTGEEEYTDLARAADNLTKMTEMVNASEGVKTKGSLFNNDWDLNTASALPQLMRTGANMALLMSAGAAGGAKGLVGGGYLSTENDYYNEAIKEGLTPDEAQGFSIMAAGGQALLELVNPQQYASGTAKGTLVRQALKALKGGMTKKDAILDGMKFVAKEIGGENLQEFSQQAHEIMSRYAMNEATGAKLDTDFTPQQAAELALMTTALSGLGAGIGRGLDKPINQQAMEWARNNPDLMREFIRKNVAQDEQEGLISRLDNLTKIYSGNRLSEMPPEKAAQVAQVIEKKQDIERDIKENPISPELESANGDPRKKEAIVHTVRAMEAMSIPKNKAAIALAGQGMLTLPDGAKIVTAPDGSSDIEVKPKKEGEEGLTKQQAIEQLVGQMESVSGEQYSEARTTNSQPEAQVDEVIEAPAPPDPSAAIPANAGGSVETEQVAPVGEQAQAVDAHPPVQAATSQAPAPSVPPAFKRTDQEPVSKNTKLEEVDVRDAAGNSYTGTEYVVPGFEEYRMVVVKNPASDSGAPSRGYKVMEPTSKAWINVTTHPTASLALLDARERMVRAGKPKLDQVISQTISNFVPDGEQATNPSPEPSVGATEGISGQQQVSEGGNGSSNFRVDPIARGREFYSGLERVHQEHRNGKAVEVKDPAFYQDPDTKLFMAPDGSAGAAVTADGDLVSVFKVPGSTADIAGILSEASQHAKTLDAYDINGFLPTLYSAFGFRPVARVRFNDEYAPSGWSYDDFGRPDVVLMAKTGSNEVVNYASVRDNVPVFDDYGDAAKVQGEAIAGSPQPPPTPAEAPAEEPDLVKKTVATKRAYEGDFRQEVKDEIDEALKRLRFHGGGKVFAATPFTVAWDAAIDAIRLARKGGLKLIDAVERGVVFFQNSDWFKSLSADKRDEATRDFRVRVYVEPLKSKLKPGQVKAAIAKAAKAQTKPLQRSFGRYMEKVLERADYADKLDHAEDVRSSIKSKLKSASANEKYSVEQSNLFKQLLTIDPDNVDDLDQYVNVAERALKSLQSLKVGKHGIENQSFEITNEELSGYLAGEIAAQRTKAKEALLEDYKQMVDDGMLSGDLTLEEMRSIINASEDDGGLDDALRNAKAEDKLAALRDFAMLKIADAKSAQKKGLLGDVSKAKSKALDNILSIDPQKLNASDIVRLNTTLNNILTNGDFGGANRIAVIGQEQANAKGLKDFFGKRGVRRQEASKAIDSWRTEAARMDAMTLDNEAAAESRRLMGSDAYGDAAHRVHKEAEHTLHDAEQKWKSLALKPKDDTFLNRARMAVYAFAIQHYGGAMDEQLRAFNTHKEMMRQSVERLTDPNASPENRKRGAIAKRAYDELIDKAKTPDDVRRSIDKVDHRLKKFVDWGVERGSAEQDRTFENVLLNENKIPEKVYNWTFMPQRLYRGASREQLESIAQRQFSYSGIDKSGSGSTTERVKSLGSDRVLDFDFTQNLLQGWQQNNYANETQETRMLMARMLLNEDVRNLLGERNIDILHRAALDKVNRDSWNTKPMSPVERKALGAAMRLMRIGSGIALKSVTQLLKQPIVLMNTMGVLGKDVGLLFKNAPNVMEAQVGRTVEGRGEYIAGVAPTGRTISPRDVGATDSDTIWRNAERKLTAMSDAADKLYRPLTGADVFSAKVAWKAFYLQNLKRRGLLDDYESRPADEQAASYANHMVERMQGSNSVTTMARVYQNDGLSGLFKYLYMPFTSFSAQTRSRMVNDINKIRLGTPEQKKQGARSLASTIGEQVSYNAMKVGLYAVTIAAARSAIRALLGGDDDKEKDDRLDERFVQGLAEDMLSPGWPGMLRSAAEELINETATTAGAEKPPIYIYNPEQYGQRDLSQYGAAAAAVKTAQRLYETSDYWDGVIDQNTKGGISPYGPAEVKRRTEQGLPTGVADSKGPKREETLPVTPQEKAAALIISAVDLMALAGFSDTQINTGINELRKELEKHIGERAGTRVYKDYMYKGNTQRGDGR
jgi:hypothetical protein